MANGHHKTPQGFLTLNTVKEQLRAKGFKARQIDYFASPGPGVTPDLIELACTHPVHPGIVFSVEMIHRDGMKLVSEAEWNAGFLPAADAVKAQNARLQEETRRGASLAVQRAAAANAVLIDGGYGNLQVDAHKGKMVMWHTGYPEFGLHAEFPADPTLFGAVIASRARAFSESYLPGHIIRLAELEATRGITVVRTPNSLVLTQPELGVKKALGMIGPTADAGHWQKVLADIDSTIQTNNSPLTMRLRLKRLSANHGFTVETATDGSGITTLTLTHPSAAWQAKSARLIGTHGIPGDAALALIAQAEAKAPSLKAPPPPAALPLISRHQRRIAPQPGAIDLVLDTSFLSNLATPREGGRTWLDLVRLAASLPGMRIVIPSIVADYELCGTLPQFDAVQASVAQAVLNPRLHALNPERNRLIEQASRLVARADGGVHAIAGADPNITVWHSPQQEEFFGIVRARKEKGLANNGSRAEFYRSLRDDYRDIGEATALAYCHSAQSTRPAVILLDDTSFFHSFNKKLGSYPRGEETRTRNGGYAISISSTPGFLRAMDRAYGDDLGPALECRYGGKEAYTNARYILAKINEEKKRLALRLHRDPEKNGTLADSMAQTVSGIDQAGNPSRPLGALFADALAWQREHPGGNGHANGNGHGDGHGVAPPPAVPAPWQDRLRGEPPSHGLDGIA